MRLYRMELYKLCRRKIFIFGTIFTFVFQFLINIRESAAIGADGNDPEYMMEIWSVSRTMYSVAMMEVGVVIFCVISTVFSCEEQTKMKPLLLTTQEGLQKDIRAKIAAAYTVTVGLWLAAALIAVFLHWSAFGFDGLKMPAGDVIWHIDDMDILRQPMGIYAAESIFVSLLGALELCAVVLAVSAKCRSTFHSVCAAAFYSAMPMIAFQILRIAYQPFYLRMVVESDYSNRLIVLLTLVSYFLSCMILSAPLYLVWPNILMDVSGMSIGVHGEIGTILFVVFLGCAVTILCVIGACRRYRRPYDS